MVLRDFKRLQLRTCWSSEMHSLALLPKSLRAAAVIGADQDGLLSSLKGSSDAKKNSDPRAYRRGQGQADSRTPCPVLRRR